MALSWLTAALLVAAAAVLWPVAPWLLVAVWGAVLVAPSHRRLSARLGNRPRLAALITVVGMVALFVPIGVVLVSLGADAFELVRRTVRSERVQSLVQPFGERSSSDVVGMAVSQGERALNIVQAIAATAAGVAIGLFIAIGGVYVLLVDGARWYAWLERHAPLPAPATRRLAGAFVETGRGLVFGFLGAGCAQAIVATIAYTALDLPHPFALGLLTLLCSVIPAIGTALVWVPVTIALAIDGQTSAAVAMGAIGVFAIGTIDNVVRPLLARRGSLQLPTYVVAVAMFGGAALMGARGVVLGPLVLRLAKEALAIRRERDGLGVAAP